MAKFFDLNCCFRQSFQDIRSTMQETPPFQELSLAKHFFLDEPLFGCYCTCSSYRRRLILFRFHEILPSKRTSTFQKNIRQKRRSHPTSFFFQRHVHCPSRIMFFFVNMVGGPKLCHPSPFSEHDENTNVTSTKRENAASFR